MRDNIIYIYIKYICIDILIYIYIYKRCGCRDTLLGQMYAEKVELHHVCCSSHTYTQLLTPSL